MIIYHQRNFAAFAGASKFYWMGQRFLNQRTTKTTAGPVNTEIEQARSLQRFVFSRVYGRVN